MASSTIIPIPEGTVSDDLTAQISELPGKKWINLQGLVDCSTAHLSRAGSGPSCSSISLLGQGGFNDVYRLVFNDGTKLAASISRAMEEYFDPRMKQSEIATMRFVRESGLYPDIPVPKVHAWDTSFKNPVGAPYILMDVVDGENLAELQGEGRLRGLDALPHPQQLHIVKALAKLQACLSRPVNFDKIGSIIVDTATGGYSVGPLMAHVSPFYTPDECTKGPFESVDQQWWSYLEAEMRYALRHWSDRKKDELPEHGRILKRTPQLFSELHQMLASLIPLFKIPQEYSQLVLHHPDLSLSNILFDKDSLSSDEPKITGVIDWEGAQILPLMLTARYPSDLMTERTFPFVRPGHKEDDWYLVPVDWTSMGDRTKWPVSYTIEDAEEILVDYTPMLPPVIGLFYLRTYFNACYAEQLYLLHGDTSLAHATLFADAVYYLKFHEMVTGGWLYWSHSKRVRWIRETYWRLKILVGRGTGDMSLIIGPNAYQRLMKMKSVVHDLGSAEECLGNENLADDCSLISSMQLLYELGEDDRSVSSISGSLISLI